MLLVFMILQWTITPSAKGTEPTNHCEPNPCQNLGLCSNNTIPPYFTCDCTNKAFEGATCSERRFVSNGTCKFHVYYENPLKFSHESAKNICMIEGGTLAMMKSAAIQDFVESVLIDQYGEGRETLALWIGGHKPQETWIWMDGTKISLPTGFQDWEGEYNKNLGLKMLMTSHDTSRDNLRWAGFPTSQKRTAFVCEKPVNNPCESSSCVNDGVCVAIGCQVNCDCPDGYEGEKCEIDHCDSNPCQNSGLCSYDATPPYFTCDCTNKAFEGTTCSERRFVSDGTCKFHVYYEKPKEFSHESAKTICINEGGTLAMMKSAAIQDFVESVLIDQYGEDGDVIALWIGGHKPQQTWIWMDGTKIPLTSGFQHWGERYKNGNKMLMTSYATTRDNLRWVGFPASQTRSAFVCEKSGATNPCEDSNCVNGGVCVAIGCQGNCDCPAGYGGEKCEIDLITIFATKTKFLVWKGQNVTVTLNITSEDGPLKIEVSKNSFEDILDTKEVLQPGLVNVTVGPLESQTPRDTYHFRATPVSGQGSYFRNTSVTISVQDHCDSNPCQNSGLCSHSTTQPYFTCDCVHKALKGATCSERRFVSNGTCKYHVYYDKSISFTHESAKTICVNEGGTLAMMKSAAIQDFVESVLIDQYGESGETIALLIGGHKPQQTWIWMDGTKIPITIGFQHWDGRYKTGNKMLMTSWESTRDNLRWAGFPASQTRSAFVCEKSGTTNPCEDSNCVNAGVCAAIGCQMNCVCLAGYGGEKCEIDLITIFATKIKFLVRKGQNVTVTLNITSEDGPVKIEVSKNSFEDILDAKEVLQSGLVNVTVGPLESQTPKDTYHFRATPVSGQGSYFRNTSVTISVQEKHCSVRIKDGKLVADADCEAGNCDSSRCFPHALPYVLSDPGDINKGMANLPPQWRVEWTFHPFMLICDYDVTERIPQIKQ